MPNLFPTEETTVAIESVQDSQAKFGKSWRFDFEKGEFLLTPTGKIAPADEMEAYAQWCTKALKTPRYRYIIYSRSYGNEFEDVIRRGLTKAAVESEIQRIVTETLMINYRTAQVTNFTFMWERNTVYFTCDVISIRGEIVPVGEKVVVS